MKNTLMRCTSLFIVSSFLLFGCGKSGNLFEKAYQPTSLEKAKQYLENDDCEAAQDELEDYLDDNPKDTEAIQLNYDAVTACLDLGMDSILTSMANAGTGEGGDLSTFVKMMPEATQENIDKLQRAVDLLTSIPADKRTSEQNAQLAIASMSVAVTTAKMLGANDDGSYDAEKAITMTDAQAQSVIDNLETSSTAMSASGADSKQVEAISKVTGGINNSEGTSASEKLKNYLAKS